MKGWGRTSTAPICVRKMSCSGLPTEILWLNVMLGEVTSIRTTMSPTTIKANPGLFSGYTKRHFTWTRVSAPALIGLPNAVPARSRVIPISAVETSKRDLGNWGETVVVGGIPPHAPKASVTASTGVRINAMRSTLLWKLFRGPCGNDPCVLRAYVRGLKSSVQRPSHSRL